MKLAELLIKLSEPGTATYCFYDRPDLRVDFFVREESRTIKSLLNPEIELRSGLFFFGKVGLVVIMFQIGSHPDQRFETWWNYYMATGEGPRYFSTMMAQPDIAFHLCGESNRIEKTFITENPLSTFLERAAKKLKSMPSWSMEAFDAQRGKIYTRYPTPSDLWNACEMS